MHPEIELLLACARVHLPPNKIEFVQELSRQALDWEQVPVLAERHRLVPLLYRHLDEVCPSSVPGKVLDALRVSSERTAGRNLFLMWQLLELLDAFKAEGIEAIPFKGPALAVALYRNVALRPFDDLDLFVRKSDLPNIRAILTARGFRPVYTFSGRQDAHYQDSNCELCYLDEARRIAIDLHWGITPEYFSIFFEPQEWWERASVITLGDREVMALSPEDLLLYLCIHGAKHTWNRLLWLSDIAELIESSPTLRYDQVVERASARHLTRMLLLGVALSRDLLGVTLPESINAELARDQAIPLLVAGVKRALSENFDGSMDMVSASTFRMNARERVIDRVRYCVKLATIPTMNDWDWAPLPQWLFPLYYLLRPVRLLLQRGLGVGSARGHRATSGACVPRPL